MTDQNNFNNNNEEIFLNEEEFDHVDADDVAGDEELADVTADEEPVPANNQRTTGGRGRKFQVNEDVQLCRSWLFVSQDRVVGNSQRGTPWWSRIFAHFRQNIPETVRSASSLESRFRDISKHVTKYCGHLSQCQSTPPSGEQDIDIQNRALERYADEFKKAFDLMHCYNVLNASPKWNNVLRASAQRATRRAVSVSARATAVAGPSSTRPPTAAGPSTQPPTVAGPSTDETDNEGEAARSIGRNQAKGKGRDKRRLDEIAARQQQMLENQDKRLQQMEEFMAFERVK